MKAAERLLRLFVVAVIAASVLASILPRLIWPLMAVLALAITARLVWFHTR